jgi:hypothetical protein
MNASPLQKARHVAVRIFYCDVHTISDSDTLYNYLEKLAEEDVDADPMIEEFPLWFPFTEFGAGDLLDAITDAAADIIRNFSATEQLCGS